MKKFENFESAKQVALAIFQAYPMRDILAQENRSTTIHLFQNPTKISGFLKKSDYR